VISRLKFDLFYLYAKFGESHFSCSGDIILGVETEDGLHDPDHVPFKGDLSSLSWDLT